MLVEDLHSGVARDTATWRQSGLISSSTCTAYVPNDYLNIMPCVIAVAIESLSKMLINSFSNVETLIWLINSAIFFGSASNFLTSCSNTPIKFSLYHDVGMTDKHDKSTRKCFLLVFVLLFVSFRQTSLKKRFFQFETYLQFV